MFENEEEFALLQAVDVLGLFDECGQTATVAVLHDDETQRVAVRRDLFVFVDELDDILVVYATQQLQLTLLDRQRSCARLLVENFHSEAVSRILVWICTTNYKYTKIRNNYVKSSYLANAFVDEWGCTGADHVLFSPYVGLETLHGMIVRHSYDVLSLTLPLSFSHFLFLSFSL